MAALILRRFFSSIVVLFCVVTITLQLALIMPGGPFDREKAVPEHIKEAQKERYKLGGTRWQQYTSYLADLVRGDLRVSFRYRDWSVQEVLAQKLPASIQIGAVAFVIASLGGVFAGVLAAVRKDRPMDWSMMFGALVAVSIPTFVSGPFLIAIFALWLGWFPIGGWGSWQHVLLPGVCLSLPYLAYVARLMRNSLIEVLKSEFLRTAKAKGLGPSEAVMRHAMKVAILPVITFLAPLAANLLTGSMVVESVFNISGAGTVFVNSIQNRDVFLLVGGVMIYCVLLIVFNFIVDVLYGVLDKRIKIHG